MKTTTNLSIVALGLFAAACSKPTPSANANTAASPTSGHIKNGLITITQTARPTATGTTPFYNAIATFIDVTPSGTSTDVEQTACTRTAMGACRVTSCPVAPASSSSDSDSDTDTTPTKQPTAGAITISSKDKITLGSNGLGIYGPKFGDKDFFAGGRKITIHAKGGDVPAFDKTLAMPPRITLSAPSWPAAGATLPVDRSADFNVTWTGGAKGSVVATITTASADRSVAVACKFDATAGAAQIPSAALAKLVPTTTGTLAVDTRSADIVTAGDWSITTIADSPALVANGVANAMAAVK